ncbi:Gldg family protein [Bacteriovorax sp. Seq25_V]|uniref:Gldg family protein n=1 Tax=Bacteriovorax sp. Seq25_V TaxID=1201288 RepID=UPI000389ED49|nr:Gldg family protein [Bacteriovorax sp. Seq25_V]EQC47555.1 hypothetical protein M900_0818 [Bacteriovorax sp. Seq25_V]
MKKYNFQILVSIVGILYLVGVFLVVTMPDNPILCLTPLLLAVIGTVVLCFMKKDEVIKLMKSTYGKNLASNIVGFFLFFVVLALVNYIAVKRAYVWDIGARKLNSLTEQTQKVIAEINDPVTFKIFSSKEYRDSIRALLDFYKNENQNFKIEYIDPEVRSDLVSKYRILRSPTVVIESPIKDHPILVTEIKELSITNGLISIQRKRDPLLCFAYMKGFEDTTDVGYTGFLHVLKESSFKLNIINLLAVSEIPRQCNVFSILSPMSDLMDSELEKVKKYYDQGGVLFVGFSPMLNGDKIGKLRSYIEELGLSISNDIVIDSKFSLNGSRGSAPIVRKFDDKNINTNISGQVFFPISSSVTLKDIEQEKNYVPLATSSNDSWAEKTILELVSEKLKFDERDVLGPIDMAAALLKNDKPRLIGLGNATLVANKFYQFQSNFTYVLNLYYWAAGEDQLTSVQAAALPEKPVFISDLQKQVILYFSVIILPLLLLCFAFIQYRRRSLI